MNWLSILVCVVILLCGFVAYQKGFIITAFSMLSLILAFLVALNTYSFISKIIINKTTWDDHINSNIQKVFHIDDTWSEAVTVNQQTKIIEDLPLPDKMKLSIIENNNAEIYKALNVQSFTDFITNYITIVIINSLSFVIMFILTSIALGIIIFFLDLLSKLPVFDGINKFAGLLLGLCEGFVIIWFLCIVLTAFSATEWGHSIFKLINQDAFLSLVYNNNYLLKIIVNMSKVLF